MRHQPHGVGVERVAGAEGFEPTTDGFGDRCSGQTELRSCVATRRF